jgi:predicted enzyme related to lactoylglutathione lyase
MGVCGGIVGSENRTCVSVCNHLVFAYLATISNKMMRSINIVGKSMSTQFRRNALCIIATILLATVLTNCSSTHKNAQHGDAQKSETASAAAVKDTTPKVTGVGGIFFFSDNPKETSTWYSQNLGLETNDYGASFETRDVSKPQEINMLQWTPFKTGSQYFAPSKKDFMINYTVQNIEGLVSKLKASGVTVLDTIETYDYGKFVHIMDPDGNKIELWEPTHDPNGDKPSK